MTFVHQNAMGGRLFRKRSLRDTFGKIPEAFIPNELTGSVDAECFLVQLLQIGS